MSRKLALKRLTASDLSLFKWHFQKNPATKQKAFNLDTSVLVNQFYPQLGQPALLPQPRYPLDLYIYGPGITTANNLQRKILKQQKNWRLNGELIDNPVDQPGLYNTLEPEDFALFDFTGDLMPTGANLVLLSKNNPNDKLIHAELNRRFPETSMSVLTERTIQDVLASSGTPSGHPLHDWIETSLLEDAALGGAAGTNAITARRAGRGISPESFMNSRKSAEATGVIGEVLANAFFEEEMRIGEILTFEWTSSINAVAPFDFCITTTDQSLRLIDVKSTSGCFNNPIHMSLAEIQTAVNSSTPYDIYRLYEVTQASGKLRIARDVGPDLSQVLSALINLPSGFTVDSISIRVENLNFEDASVLI